MRGDALQSPDEDSVRKRRKRDPENREQEKISRIRRGGSGKQAYRKQRHGGCCLFIKRDDGGRISPAHMHAIEHGQYRVRRSRDNSPEDALEIGVVRMERRRNQQNACQRDKGVDGIARPERLPEKQGLQKHGKDRKCCRGQQPDRYAGQLDGIVKYGPMEREQYSGQDQPQQADGGMETQTLPGAQKIEKKRILKDLWQGSQETF